MLDLIIQYIESIDQINPGYERLPQIVEGDFNPTTLDKKLWNAFVKKLEDKGFIMAEPFENDSGNKLDFIFYRGLELRSQICEDIFIWKDRKGNHYPLRLTARIN
jgi:hypothetical protein